MGYKLAGYDVIGNCEIDPKIIEIYRKNNHPRHSYLMDIRDFCSRDDLPPELYDLDILDGSPPCSVFSMCGSREDGWNVEKKFREGQKKQRLDDLFLHFIAVVKKLQPKVVIAENVKGLLAGNAKGYVREIISTFGDAGYNVQLFLLNSAAMGVPQRRERCFFVCSRKDLNFPKLRLAFNEPPILFGSVRSATGKLVTGEKSILVTKNIRPGDRDFSEVNERIRGERTRYSAKIVWDKDISYTLCSGSEFLRGCDKTWFSTQDCVSVQTFPQDYDFGDQDAKYIYGMSVPPVMMAQIATEIGDQWFTQ